MRNLLISLSSGLLINESEVQCLYLWLVLFVKMDFNIFEPVKGVELIDLGIYVKEQRVLIIADIHIGYEGALNKQGVFVPKFHFKDLIKRLESLFEFLDAHDHPVDTILVNGDLKHEFGVISDEEWRNVLKFLDFLRRRSKNVVLIRGNHDKALGPLADKRDVLFVDSFLLGDILVCHGDKVPVIPSSVKTLIIGHDHPAVSLRDGLRVETFKSFLVGKYKRKNLIVQPSFNQLVEGTDVLKESPLSPFLHRDLSMFDVYIVADSVYYFGKVKKLKDL